MKMGIITEDDSDFDVITKLTLALLEPRRVSFKKFVGDGCGKLRRKCGAWSQNLVSQGCSWIVVVHDLDEFDEDDLRTTLTAAVAPSRAKDYVVLIPKREIEAWLLYDAAALAAAFNERRLLSLPANPESVINPKEYLGRLIWAKYRKRYLHTLHNAKIAQYISTSALGSSKSFIPHSEFVERIKSKVKARS